MRVGAVLVQVLEVVLVEAVLHHHCSPSEQEVGAEEQQTCLGV